MADALGRKRQLMRVRFALDVLGVKLEFSLEGEFISILTEKFQPLAHTPVGRIVRDSTNVSSLVIFTLEESDQKQTLVLFGK